MDKEKPLKISNLTLSSRFFLGSSGYSSPFELTLAIKQSEASLITMGVKRLGIESLNNSEGWLKEISGCGVPILPNTAGCRNARDAITVAEIARELFNTNLIKLEVVGDDFSLQPNPFELVEAAKAAARFSVELGSMSVCSNNSTSQPCFESINAVSLPNKPAPTMPTFFICYQNIFWNPDF